MGVVRLEQQDPPQDALALAAEGAVQYFSGGIY